MNEQHHHIVKSHDEEQTALRDTLIHMGQLAATQLETALNAVARREYVEDIRVYGFSFNTNIGEASVFGEIAYRPNLPVGISATNDLLGDLLIPGFFGETNIYDGNVPGDQACADISGKQLCRGPIFHNYERIEAFNLFNTPQ